MPQVEGRGIQKPVVGESYMGAKLVLRIDDKRNPITWMTLTFTPEEFGELFDRYATWLQTSEQPLALDALMFKKD